MLREIPLGQDGDFSIAALERRYRSDLANELGNLLQRSLSMIIKYRNGKMPRRGQDPRGDAILDDLAAFRNEYHESMENLRFSQVLEGIWLRLRRANRYIEESKPWQLHRSGEDRKLDGVLFALGNVLAVAAALLQPFMPTVTDLIRLQLDREACSLPDVFSPGQWSTKEFITGGRAVGAPAPLFPVDKMG
jgi:methionyl-tRNA synthetase